MQSWTEGALVRVGRLCRLMQVVRLAAASLQKAVVVETCNIVTPSRKRVESETWLQRGSKCKLSLFAIHSMDLGSFWHVRSL